MPLYWAAYGPTGGQRVLVLHGGPGAHHDYMLPQLLALADGRELVFYDQRGGGRSKTDDRAPIGWRTHVADLALVARELGIARPLLFGYSWGALLAMLYAIEANRDGADLPMPSALALLSPAPASRAFRDRFESEFARRQQGARVLALREELATSGLRERDPEAHRQRQFELGVAGYFADPALASNLTPFRVTGRVQQQVWESLGDFDVIGPLAALRVPALVVHGRDDPIPLESAEACARALGATCVVLDQCGHVPYVEQPAATIAALNRFLDER